MSDNDVASTKEINNYNDYEEQPEEVSLTTCNPVECMKKCMQSKVGGVCVNQTCFCLNKKSSILSR